MRAQQRNRLFWLLEQIKSHTEAIKKDDFDSPAIDLIIEFAATGLSLLSGDSNITRREKCPTQRKIVQRNGQFHLSAKTKKQGAKQ